MPRSIPLTLMLTILCDGACNASERLVAERELMVPLGELSGLASLTIDGEPSLLAVGDEDRALVVTPLVDGSPDPARARRIALPMPDVAGGSQLEAVTVDAAGDVWVLAEPGEVYAYALEGGTARELWRRSIVVPPGHPLASAWATDPNNRAEGLALVGERVFIVKQSDPVALVELAVDGDRFVAGRAFTLADLEDANELTLHGGELYVVGARSQLICALEVPGDAAPSALRCKRAWRLPEHLGKGKPKWEGLAFLPDGHPVVGVDRKKTDRPNLAVLPAL